MFTRFRDFGGKLFRCFDFEVTLLKIVTKTNFLGRKTRQIGGKCKYLFIKAKLGLELLFTFQTRHHFAITDYV
jgi:hypothetical protein